MKLAASNIGWDDSQDNEMYRFLQDVGCEGIEIAPTRISKEKPYINVQEASAWSKKIYEYYGLKVSSMQSIWYGIKDNIFASKEEKERLFEYTKIAIEYANILQCKNIVFGCPRNRCVPDGMESDLAQAIAYEFFSELGQYAFDNNTCISIEANPQIYNTNFLNTTKEVYEFVDKLHMDGIMINLDYGAMIQNNETVASIHNYIGYVNHVHISEPNLFMIKEREEHRLLLECLKRNSYNKYISVEMKKSDSVLEIQRAIVYLSNLLNC